MAKENLKAQAANREETDEERRKREQREKQQTGMGEQGSRQA